MFEGLGWKVHEIALHVETKADPESLEKVESIPKLTKLFRNAFLIYPRKLTSSMTIDEVILVPHLNYFYFTFVL